MYKTILVPVDITEPELTQQVIPHVNALARLEDSHVHFLAVETKDETIAVATEGLAKAAKQFSVPEDRVTTHVAVGDPKDQILELADALNAEIIVMGSNRPSAMTYLLGSNATAVVRHANCPVLVVRESANA
jgi:universal stress protein F